jgi:hypothetical protein
MVPSIPEELHIAVIHYLDTSKWQLKFTQIPVWTTWNKAPLKNIYSDRKGAFVQRELSA